MLILISLLACADYELLGPEDDGPSEGDASDCPPQIPDCQDTGPVDTGPKDTGEGVSDCEVTLAAAGTVALSEECSTASPADAFDLKQELQFSYTGWGGGPIVTPAIGNLTDDNGDGVIDASDTPDIAFTVWEDGSLVALSGDGSGPLFTLSGYNSASGVAIADVSGDGTPTLLAFDQQKRIVAVDGTGAEVWSSDPFQHAAYPEFAVADLEGDGVAEVIGDLGVVDGRDGSTRFTLSDPGSVYRSPVVADLDQDGTQEIILGDRVYDHKGAVEWKAYSAVNAFAAVADIDGEPQGELFLAAGDAVYVYEDDGRSIEHFPVPGGQAGPPCMADFDGDGEIELAVSGTRRISVLETDGSVLWQRGVDEATGLAGCSGFDLDQDGAFEVLYASQGSFMVLNGSTGEVRFEYGGHGSSTLHEYPVVADVDADGAAEICLSSNGTKDRGLSCFGHEEGLPAVGPNWSFHSFADSLVLDDGSVASAPVASWKRDQVFRARSGREGTAGAELGGKYTDMCIADCSSGPVKVSFQAWNQGAEDLDAGVPFAVYAVNEADEVLVHQGTLPAMASGEAPEGLSFALDPQDWGDFGLVIRLDDDGSGAGTLEECEEDDNALLLPFGVC